MEIVRSDVHELLGEHGKDVGERFNESDLDARGEFGVPLHDFERTDWLSS